MKIHPFDSGVLNLQFVKITDLDLHTKGRKLK